MARIALLCLFAALLAGCSNVATAERPAASCVSPRAVVPIGFSANKYPNIRRHYERAVAHGFPTVLVLHRAGADTRRDRLLQSRATRSGMDRDEYPPAVGRASVRASVGYVPSSENRSHGATLGIKLRRYCDGTRFRYVFY
jgi:Deoxyribonuclease NucA/NucB